MGTKLGFSIESSLASNHLTDAIYIKGGFFVVEDTDKRNALKVATADQDGTIEDGSLCFCKADRKFYQYDGREVDGVVKGWVEKNFSEGGGSGGGEQGTPRATNYLFEEIDEFYDFIVYNKNQLVKGDAFYITEHYLSELGSDITLPVYIWDGTTLQETIMPFAKLPLPEWLDEGDGTMKKGLSLMDIGNMPDWLSALTMIFDKGESFKNYVPFEESVNDIVAEKNYATTSEIPTKVSELKDADDYAKTSDIPSLDGYAKTTDIPSLDGYAKTSDIPSLEGYAKTSDIPSDAHINTLINTALEDVLNGEY